MKIRYLIILGLLLIVANSKAAKFTISGQITDAESGEDMIAATVGVKELPSVGTITNEYGFYSLTLEEGEYNITYNYVGYKTQVVPISLTENRTKNIELASSASSLTEIEIKAEKEDKNVTLNEMSVTRIDPKEIEQIPVIFGERDIIKTIQLYPGIKSAGEGNTGYYVRGGGADQNLILLDEAPVYNASHLLGFFSVFNSDAIKDVKVYKGGMPAEFGGRLSSVMDIKMKEGNYKKYSASGGIGLISSKLTLEGPLVQDKGSFIVSGRRTYADLFLKLSSDELQRNSSLYFYDLNMKANYRLGEKDRIFVSGYFGRDVFSLADVFGFSWGNATLTARWNHTFNSKLFSNTSLIYSDYDYKINITVSDFDLEIGSSIEDFNFKEDLNYYINDRHTLNFGANIIYHTFKPGEVGGESQAQFSGSEVENRVALESVGYVSMESKFGSKLTTRYGFRYNNFSQLGPGNVYSYNDNGVVIDTAVYGKGDFVETYHGLAPRASATYLLNEKSSLKSSYGRNYQYLHLLTNTAASSPTDLWVPSSNNVKPQIADQLAIGYFRNFKDNMFEMSTELYYKNMQNVIDYRVGADVTLNATVEGDLLFGDGRAYGVEFMLKKRKGIFTGWISYTLSRSEKRFEDINANSWYPARQDRLHDVTLVGMLQINERANLSGTWVYYTGDAVTFPTGKYSIGDQVISYYTERNGYRMPDYHRFDLGLTLKNRAVKVKYDKKTGVELKRKVRSHESSWNFSIYNVYARENAWSITFEEDPDDASKTQAVQLSLFSIIPSVTYNFKF